MTDHWTRSAAELHRITTSGVWQVHGTFVLLIRGGTGSDGPWWMLAAAHEDLTGQTTWWLERHGLGGERRHRSRRDAHRAVQAAMAVETPPIAPPPLVLTRVQAGEYRCGSFRIVRSGSSWDARDSTRPGMTQLFSTLSEARLGIATDPETYDPGDAPCL